MESPALRPAPSTGLARWAWFGTGWVCVGLGGVGVVVPGLPTTVFFIGAAGCFARSSPRFERWVLNLPTIGPMVRDHRAGLGMPLRAKVAAVATILIVSSLSAAVVSAPAARIGIVAAGLAGAGYVAFRVPTRPK